MSIIRFKKRNAIIGGLLYLYVISQIVGVSILLGSFFVFFLVGYIALCMYATYVMIKRARAREEADTVEFNRYHGLDAFGVEWTSFFHVFRCKDPVAEQAVIDIGKRLNADLARHELRKIDIRDRASDLAKSETRIFFCTSGITTSRGATVTFAMYPSRMGDVQGVRWWVLARGVRDPNKLFWRYAGSPLFVPFLLPVYLTGRAKPLAWIRSTDLGFYNGLDMLSFARKIEFVAFYALIDALEGHGIDTSDLKAQVGSVLNINVSGGSANFGNVVQGAFNRLGGTGVGQGARAT